MTELRSFGFCEQHQQIYDMAWRYARDRHHPLLRRPSAALLALRLVISPLPLRAGDLNTEVNDMFNNLGAIGNYTAPGAFRGQTFNTYTGGNLMMRSPNKVYPLAAIQVPCAKAGCSGSGGLLTFRFSRLSGRCRC